jgi:hypothetical protein
VQIQKILSECYSVSKDAKSLITQRKLITKIKNRLRNERGGYIKMERGGDS